MGAQSTSSKPGDHPMPSRLRILLPVLALALTVAACGGAASSTPGASAQPPATTPAASASAEASSAPGTSSAPAAICADATAFRASVTALTTIKLLDVGTSGVQAALADVKTSAEALLVSGKDMVAQPVANLMAAVTALQATLTGLGDQPSLGASAVAIKTAVAGIKTAADDVVTALNTTCPATQG
jgi:hypothetical protein